MTYKKREERPYSFSLTMTSFRYLCIYCIISVSLVTAYETCRLRNGERGYCIVIRDCESAKTELKSRVKPLICTFDKEIPIVCCDLSRNRIHVNDTSRNSIKFEESNEADNLTLLFSHSREYATSNDGSTNNTIKHFSTSKLPNRNHGEIVKYGLESIKKPLLSKPTIFRGPNLSFQSTSLPETVFDRNKRIQFEAYSTSVSASGSVNEGLLSFLSSNHRPIRFDGPVTDDFKIPKKNTFNFIIKTPLKLGTVNSSTINNAIEASTTHMLNKERETSTHANENSSTDFEHVTESIYNSQNGPIGKAEKACQEIVDYGKQYITRTRYITNGQNADHFEFPHMAALGYDDDKSGMQWQCGGSLISNQFVMTAAHCTHSKSGPIKVVRLGDIDTIDDPNDSDVQTFDVINTFVHPLYNQSSFYNDIALLELNKPINYTRGVMPACLQNSFDFGNPTLWATGWGTLYYGGESSNVLQKVDLQQFSTKECNGKAYGRQRRLSNGILDEMQICAGNPEQGKDTCQGDSGGPLQIKMFDHLNIYKIVGITSFGIKCGIIQGIYTRVSHYLPWIEDIVWNN
ncbi:hypothetical protein Trydic_g18726 [Trypoxylus dichotomus]